jgi:hypothetical protein
MNSAITLNVSDLKSTALPGLGKLVGRSRTLPVLQTVRVTRDLKGDVSLQSTDLDSHAIFHVPETQEGAPIDMLVPFEPLNRLIKTLGGKDTITLQREGKNKVKVHYQVSGSEMDQSFESLPVDEFPPTPVVNQKPFAVGPEFGLAVKQAFQCASQEQSRQVLHGASLDVHDAQAHYIVGTNGRILFSANSFTFPFKKSVTVPNCKFLAQTDLLDGDCMLAVEPPAPKQEYGYLKLATPSWTFIAREHIGPFPNWRQCVPLMEKPAAVVKLGPAAIKQMLEVLPHLPGKDLPNHTVRLDVKIGLLKLEGPDHESGVWTGVSVFDVNITGKPMMIALDREFLAIALKFNLGELRLEDELSAMVFSNGGKRMVVMPVRLSVERTQPAPAHAPATSPESTAAEPAAAPSTITEPKPDAAAEPKENAMNATTLPAPERGSLKSNGNSTITKPAETNTPPTLIDQIELIKESVRNVGRDLNNLIEAVKTAEKQQRATEREVESARATLKKLQQVTI